MKMTSGTDVNEKKYVKIEHTGKHTHKRSPPIRSKASGNFNLAAMIAANPSIKPKALSVGSNDRPAAHTFDDAFANDNRVRNCY